MSTWEDARKRADELTAAGDVVALDVGDNYALTVPSDTSSEAVARYLTGIAQWEAMGKDKPLIVELDDEQKRLPSFVYPLKRPALKPAACSSSRTIRSGQRTWTTGSISNGHAYTDCFVWRA